MSYFVIDTSTLNNNEGIDTYIPNKREREKNMIKLLVKIKYIIKLVNSKMRERISIFSFNNTLNGFILLISHKFNIEYKCLIISLIFSMLV